MIFEDMSLEEVINYINGELKNGRSMKDIEVNDFGVNERVLVKRLERRRVKKVNGQFVVQDDSNTPKADVVGAIAPLRSNNPNTKVIIREPINIIEDEHFIGLANKVAAIEKVVTELMVRSTETPSIEESNDFIVYSTDDKPIGKTVRLYKEIWEGLDKVREIYPHLSAQTIINSLLNEIIGKYVK